MQALRDRGQTGRYRLVWQLLERALASVTVDGRDPLVLDCGGGTGRVAVPLAQAGARVTVIDISADALATLQRRADEAGVGERILPVQGDVDLLADIVPAGEFDLVLAHGVLEQVDHGAEAVAAVARALRPGALASLLIGNPVAGVLGRALVGDVEAALEHLRALATDAPAVTPLTIAGLCAGAGLNVEEVHGIGVFAELVPGAELDVRPGALDALATLEEEASGRTPFRDIASRVHVLARRPAE